MQRTGIRGATGTPQRAASAAAPPIEVISGGMLCRLHVWNESEWANLSERERPLEFTHVPGLGWVGAVPVNGLN